MIVMAQSASVVPKNYTRMSCFSLWNTRVAQLDLVLPLFTATAATMLVKIEQPRARSAPARSVLFVCEAQAHSLPISSVPRPTDFKKSLAYGVVRNGLHFHARTCSRSDNKYTGRCLLCLSLDKPCFPGRRRLIHWRQWYLL